MRIMSNYLIIIPTCIFVKGFSRSAIYDTQREVIDFIPNDLYNFCLESNKRQICETLSQYSGEDLEIANEYIDFLLQNEYAFLGSLHDTVQIDNLSMKYNYLGEITNCICEYSPIINRKIKKLCHILDENMKCRAFQLISFDKKIALDKLEHILNHFMECIYIHHVELILPFNEDYTLDKLHMLLLKYFCINRIIIHSSPKDILEKNDHTILLYVKQSISKYDSCGFVEKDYFSLNLPHITESMKYNNCLHKKIFIDKNGNVKNCPYMNDKCGNVFTDEIHDIITKKFRWLWNISKDKIQVCQDCEFRYACSDCRIFIKDPTNPYSQPAKCNYNPYIGKWIDEDGYMTVEEFRKKDIHTPNKQ
jgi:SPASM domain peptide maturase of grasp-with-spasm system